MHKTDGQKVKIKATEVEVPCWHLNTQGAAFHIMQLPIYEASRHFWGMPIFNLFYLQFCLNFQALLPAEVVNMHPDLWGSHMTNQPHHIYQSINTSTTSTHLISVAAWTAMDVVISHILPAVVKKKLVIISRICQFAQCNISGVDRKLKDTSESEHFSFAEKPKVKRFFPPQIQMTFCNYFHVFIILHEDYIAPRYKIGETFLYKSPNYLMNYISE